jgi:hypothetical protein
MKSQKNAVLRLLLILSIVVGISCSKSEDQPEPEPQAQAVVDPELVGSWEGTIDGSFGEADMTLTLKSNGDLSGEGSTALYCPMEANWEVKGGRFKANGKDKCDGTGVTMDAPYSKTTLKGTWEASSGNSGTFEVHKK